MSVYIGNKNGIYELPHDLSNDLQFRMLGSLEISRKISKLHESIAYSCLIFFSK